jgi:hypothetical protein
MNENTATGKNTKSINENERKQERTKIQKERLQSLVLECFGAQQHRLVVSDLEHKIPGKYSRLVAIIEFSSNKIFE